MSSVSICSPYRQATAFSLAEILLQKSIPVIGEPLLNFIMTGELISPVRWFNRSMMCGWLYNSSLCLLPSDPYFSQLHYHNSIICLPLGFIFTCTLQKNLWWSCLNSYVLGSYCTVGLLITSISLCSQSETQDCSSPLSLHHRTKWELPGDFSDNEEIRFLRILFQWWWGIGIIE